MTTKGVIDTATGDLKRAGEVTPAWDQLPDFDSETESYRTDVPVPSKGKKVVSFPAGTPFQWDKFHNWNGSAWIEVAY